MYTLSTTHPNVKNYSIGHKSKTNWQKQNKGVLENIFLHLYTCFGGQNPKYKWPKIFVELFWHLGNQHLMAKQTAQRWDTQKSKIGYPEHPRLHLWTDSWCNTSIISALNPSWKCQKSGSQLLMAHSTPLSVLDWETNWPWFSLGTSPPKN